MAINEENIDVSLNEMSSINAIVKWHGWPGGCQNG
jgi:hypothetical protein